MTTCRPLSRAAALVLAPLALACATPPPDAPPVEEPADEEQPPPGIVGAIQLVELRLPAEMMGVAQASARFIYFDPAWLDESEDSEEEEQPCSLYLDDAGAAPVTPELEPDERDVGAIAVQGGRVDVFLQFAGRAYDAAMPEGVLDLFDGGDQLLALGAGNEETGATEFEAEVTAPADLVVTAPAAVSSVSAAEDLVVAWDPGPASDDVEVILQSRSEDGALTGTVLCAVSDADGSVVVPQDLLAELPKGDALFEVDRVARGFGRTGPVATSLYAISANLWQVTVE